MFALYPYQVSSGIYPQEDEQEYCESPKGRASVGEEWQRNADDRCQSQDHSHVDEQVEKEDAHDAIAIDAPELERLPLSNVDKAEYEA